MGVPSGFSEVPSRARRPRSAALVWIRDRQLGLPAAVFTDLLRVGWMAILILDVLGKRITAAPRTLLAADPRDDLPLEVREALEKLDREE